MLVSLFFILTYGWPLGMAAYAAWDYKKRNKKLGNTGVRL